MAGPDEPEQPVVQGADADGVSIVAPDLLHGPQLWQLARESKVLDVNSSYAYLMWCRDFAATSAVALDGGDVVGFVTGYLRPQATDTLMIWQVAVDAGQRGRRLAARMLHDILDRSAPRWMHTTITPSNKASIRLFTAVARDRATTIERREQFDPQLLPGVDGGAHEPEDLYVIGPLSGTRHGT
ncbi:MAG: diaminobutyrate acetyltransferase [Pseudonocardiaceae bacterium]|nr:diaminobutyrate acetyltransferase [Pseudonocardiaceae bacterium]